MMKKGTCIDSASLDPTPASKGGIDKERMLKYKEFSVAFSYPDDNFFATFPGLSCEKDKLISEYDRLFRLNEIWLYATEYLVQNEFQRANELSDIMGFYKAFGVEPDKDRPDSLVGELEFMHYLIFKRLHALKNENSSEANEKAFICLDARKKFFVRHLYPSAKKIAEAIVVQAKNNFYQETAKELLKFLESEDRFFTKNR